MLMFGNLLKEAGSTSRLADVASNGLMSVITILLGTTVGATTSGDTFLTVKTLGILVLGLTAFCIGVIGSAIAAGILLSIYGK